MSAEYQITLLGIAVVFLGLILTSLMIYTFSIFDKIFLRKKEKKEKTAESISTPAVESKVSDEIIAILSTIIEIEMRLKISLDESKFTFSGNRQQ